MIVIVTDERGDDYAQLEDAINQLSRTGIKVYCIGNAAVFGREKGYVQHTWTHEGQEFTDDIPVDQGPETVAPERLLLPFWVGNNRRYERMSAGYGPYALTRLCAETGGMYLVAADSVGQHFDFGLMRNYLPDYRPIQMYDQQLQSNKAKLSLVEAARKTRVDRIPPPQLQFQANTDNVLRTQITEAQKPLAVVEHQLRLMHQMLSAGEQDRKKLTSPRWQASYDLAMGRLAAMLVRVAGYNVVLADMKSNPKSFKNAGNNMWRLVTSKDVKAGPAVRKYQKQAEEYLKRVINDHPGTPWAMLAEVELGDGKLGWAWEEGAMRIAATNMGNNQNNPQFAQEQERMRREQRRRQQMNKSRPNL